MKKIVICLVSFIILLSITSCEASYVTESRELYELYFKKTLKDPESFKLYDEKYINLGNCVEWTLDYGARNSLGGMIRETIKIRTYKTKIQVDGYKEYSIDELK